jgi:hypothetical protein
MCTWVNFGRFVITVCGTNVVIITDINAAYHVMGTPENSKSASSIHDIFHAKAISTMMS